MDERWRRVINDIAEKVRGLMELSDKPDVDMDDVVKRLGGTISRFSDYSSYERIIKGEGLNFKIEINENNAETRQRFSIAHELGHLFLHMKFPSSEWEAIAVGEMHRRTPGMYSITEEEASEFAGAFLMPAELFRKAIKQHSEDRDKIAKHFNVSADAVARRGRNLGIWK